MMEILKLLYNWLHSRVDGLGKQYIEGGGKLK